MLNDYWPLSGLRVRTPRLELRLPSDDELAEVADVAARGVHPPGEKPFLTPWTDKPPAEVARTVVQRHWRRLGSWKPGDWALELVVFEHGKPLGIQDMRAKEFAVLREVASGSWLGLEHQGRGIGAEMRAAMLHLAFSGLGATDATTASFVDNLAPLAVSRKLGYRDDGISRDVLHGRVAVSQRLRLTRQQWESTARPEVMIEGLDPCLSLFVG